VADGVAGGRGGTTGRAPAPEPLAVPVFDSHTHLDLLDTPVEETMAAARAVGIEWVLTIGVDAATSRWAAETAAAHPHVYGAVAIHPNDAQQATPEVLAELAELARRPDVRAVGETGLDYYRDWCPPDQQREAFRAHIRIAKEAGVALAIHDRDAHDDVLRILDEEGPPEHVVFHCYSGDAEMAKTCADRGYLMSFAGNVTFKNAPALREAAAVAPPELILVETDAPFLTPVPYRGRPNAPYLVPLTVRCLAEVKGMDLDTLCAAIAANGRRAFGV
jgi:TatD DNase family protein